MYDEETVNLRVNRPFYIDFGCHTHIVNDALTFCTILTKFDFFIKNRRFWVKIMIFEKSQESVLQFVLQFIRKIVLKSEKWWQSENKFEKQKSLETRINTGFSRLFFGRGTRTRTLGTRFWRPLIKSSVTRMNTTFSDKLIDAYYSLYYNFWKRYFMRLFIQKTSHL